MTGGQDLSNKSAPVRPLGRREWLILLRYALPGFVALTVLVFSLFHNVYASQGGREIGVSILPLWFSTLKAARTYLLGGDVVAGGRAFYTVLALCAVIAALFFVISMAACVFSLYSLRRVMRARAAADEKGEREAKILFRAFLPGRGWLVLTNLLSLPLAIFPEIFSFVCGRFLTASKGQALYIRFNTTAAVALVLLLAVLLLAVYERRHARDAGLDLFYIKEEAEEEE